MTNDEALETYIHDPDYYEKEQEGIKCDRCGQFIPADEKYYELENIGQIYCCECMDDMYGKVNWV